jgi:hypothetical protein
MIDYDFRPNWIRVSEKRLAGSGYKLNEDHFEYDWGRASIVDRKTGQYYCAEEFWNYRCYDIETVFKCKAKTIGGQKRWFSELYKISIFKPSPTVLIHLIQVDVFYMTEEELIVHKLNGWFENYSTVLDYFVKMK